VLSINETLAYFKECVPDSKKIHFHEKLLRDQNQRSIYFPEKVPTPFEMLKKYNNINNNINIIKFFFIPKIAQDLFGVNTDQFARSRFGLISQLTYGTIFCTGIMMTRAQN
jgi:hypothetical protein